ncbi:acyl-CoA carboxylase subunit epsilon [Streptomyces arboris]|uniref:acyl-CoA carboxylase subunit epsilon n=1 Tax=Streptomyces arboris TaxID=2600619 RepID=UPI003C2B840D
MSALPIKVVRGEPTLEELAACVLVLRSRTAALAAHSMAVPDGPEPSTWQRPTTPLTAPAASWSSGRAGSWRTRPGRGGATGLDGG